MKKYLQFIVLFGAVLSPAFAHDYKIGTLEVGHPWTRASSGKVAGGFLTITNRGPQPDRLVGGSFENADKVEIHESTMEGNVAKMRAAAGGIEIKPGETVELKPGSFHIMFMGLTQPVKDGEKIKGTLVFEKAGTLAVEYTVQRQAPSGQQSGHQGH